MDGFRSLTRWCLEDVSVCVVDLSGGLEHLEAGVNGGCRWVPVAVGLGNSS